MDLIAGHALCAYRVGVTRVRYLRDQPWNVLQCAQNRA